MLFSLHALLSHSTLLLLCRLWLVHDTNLTPSVLPYARVSPNAALRMCRVFLSVRNWLPAGLGGID